MAESHSETEQKINKNMPDENNKGKVKPPLVSVIVPVYNVEQYLEYCLNSILYQTYKKLEIILIDDASTDGSGRICDRYAAKDQRVRVIHRENAGLSAARNAGIEVMNGEWVTFVDSDDYIRCDMIEKMVMIALKDGSDIALVLHKKTALNLEFRRSGIKESDQNHDKSGKKRGEGIRRKKYDRRSFQLDILSGKLAMYSHGKLYKSSLFESIRFPEGKLYEDVPTTWAVSKIINKASFLGEELYFYRQRIGSIVNAPFKPGRMDQVYAAEAIYEEVKGDEELEPIAASRCFFSAADNYSLVTKEFPKEAGYLKDAIKKYRKGVLRDKRAGKNLKLMAMVAGMGPAPVRLLGKMYKKKQSLSR